MFFVSCMTTTTFVFYSYNVIAYFFAHCRLSYIAQSSCDVYAEMAVYIPSCQYRYRVGNVIISCYDYHEK